MNFLIGGRSKWKFCGLTFDSKSFVAIQGLGAGAITALIQIIIADLVPLKERGSFNGVMAL